ncbi:IS3 family transposase [Acinetobacter haemolyticus]|uniref:IS3 family transposase n=1 Tax=Acinetobacter haemolyticus TaxID=29430 RepID=UPI0034DABFF3
MNDLIKVKLKGLSPVEYRTQSLKSLNQNVQLIGVRPLIMLNYPMVLKVHKSLKFYFLLNR